MVKRVGSSVRGGGSWDGGGDTVGKVGGLQVSGEGWCLLGGGGGADFAVRYTGIALHWAKPEAC